MEKRALLAFVASILLFLAYDYFYLSPRVKEQRQQRTAEMQRQQQVADSLAAVLGVETGGTEQPTTALPGAGTVDEVGAPAGDEQQKTLETEPPPGLPEVEMADAADFTVVSPLYEITLSTAGAELVSVRLLEYETAGEPVELIAYDSDWTHARALNVTLEGSASSMSLAAVSFSAYLGGVGEPLFSGSKVTVSPSREMTEVVFRASQNGNGAIERYYRFYPDRYDFDTGVRFAASTFPAATGIWWGMGPGLRSTEANEQDDQQSFKAAVKLGEDIHRLKPGAFSKKNKEEFAGTLGWTSLQTKYFIAAMIPPEPTRATAIVSGYKPDHRISNRFMVPAIVNRGRVENSIKVYLGPLDYKIIKALDVGLQDNIEMGWSLLRPVSWLVLWSLTWAYKFIPNYGLVIILISVLTKVLFYRLTHKSFKSMKDLQDLQPRIQALKEKFGDDKQRLSQETMKLYKEAGVNPLGGCLPMLLQMPVFIALFQVLRGTIELRQAPFVGWITDLSQQDVLFALPATLPVIGNAFSLLPILMGASMLAQTKIGGSITGTPGAQTTPKGFNTMLPIVFTFLFYKMPSGLVIYWIVNTVLSVAQQYYIHREPDKDKDGASDNPAPKGKPQKRRIKSKGR
jgi:YidC/Oxa1 family membrane protein insertase